MSHTVRAIVLVVFVLATAIWLGGYVAIGVVARVAARTLLPAQRVAFFRGLGRSYGVVGGTALVIALATGAALVGNRAWSTTLTVTAVAAAGLMSVTVAGVVQARQMTRQRRALLDQPDDSLLATQVRAGARQAGLLRAAIGVLSLTLVVLGSMLAA